MIPKCREQSFLQDLLKVKTRLITRDQAEDTEPREGIEPRAESSETGSREVEPTTSTNQQPRTQIVLPRHTAVSGMDPSFVNYFRERGMTPYLMKSLMTKHGWTLEMVNRVIRNCNAALKTNVAPVQSLRYSDEVDTDEELGPLPRTKDNASAAATTVTSETLYVGGETSAQRGTAIQSGNRDKERERTRCTNTDSSQGTPRFTTRARAKRST